MELPRTARWPRAAIRTYSWSETPAWGRARQGPITGPRRTSRATTTRRSSSDLRLIAYPVRPTPKNVSGTPGARVAAARPAAPAACGSFLAREYLLVLRVKGVRRYFVVIALTPAVLGDYTRGFPGQEGAGAAWHCCRLRRWGSPRLRCACCLGVRSAFLPRCCAAPCVSSVWLASGGVMPCSGARAGVPRVTPALGPQGSAPEASRAPGEPP